VLSVLRKIGGVEDFKKMKKDCPNWGDVDEIPYYRHFQDGLFVKHGAKDKKGCAWSSNYDKKY